LIKYSLDIAGYGVVAKKNFAKGDFLLEYFYIQKHEGSCLIKYSLDIAGYGVVAKKNFAKGDFLLEYKGDLIDNEEAIARNEEYKKLDAGCFMYYFRHHGKVMWLVRIVCLLCF